MILGTLIFPVVDTGCTGWYCVLWHFTLSVLGCTQYYWDLHTAYMKQYAVFSIADTKGYWRRILEMLKIKTMYSGLVSLLPFRVSCCRQQGVS